MPDLGKAYVQIVPSAEDISGGISDIVLPEADSAGESAGRSMGDKLATALKATLIAAGIGAIIKQAVGSVNELADYGDNIDKMSQKMGMSASTYQEWDAVMQHSGTSMETMKASMKTLANAAETGNAAFEKLGITQEELQTLNQEQLFERTIEALQNVEDDTQRTYLAGKTLGRGATELGALLNTSAEDTKKMRDRVHELGGVMSDKAVKDAAAYKDSLQDMQTAISGFGRGIVQEFLPSFTQIMDGIAEIFSGDAGTGVGMVMDGVKNIGKKIIETVPQVVRAGGEIISGIIRGIAERLPGLVVQGATALGEFVRGLWEKIPQLITTGAQTIATFLSGLSERMPELINTGGDAISNFITGLIEKIPSLISAIGEQLPVIVAAVGDIIIAIANFLAKNFPLFVQKGIEIIQNLAQGLVDNWPAISQAIGDTLVKLLQAIINYLPKLLQAGIQLITSLVRGMLQIRGSVVSSAGNLAQAALSKLLSFIGQMLSAGARWISSVVSGLLNGAGRLASAAASVARNALSSFLSIDWASVGSNIISGIVGGLWSAAGSLFSSLRSLASSALSAAKDALDIGSPSKVFRDEVGKWIPEGIAEGIASVDTPTIEIEKTVNGMVSATSAQLSRATLGAPQVAGSPAVAGEWTINVYAAPGMDENMLADKVARKINQQIRTKGAVYA